MQVQNAELMQLTTTTTSRPVTMDFLRQKIKNHLGPQEDFSDVALQAPGGNSVRNFNVPTKTPAFEKTMTTQIPTPTTLLMPSLVSVSGESSSLPSVPRSTTASSAEVTAMDAFREDLIQTGGDKTKLEDEIMSMIIADPETVVETIAGMLDHATDVEEIEQKLQLVDMIEKDPLAATVAFTDLLSQKMEEEMELAKLLVVQVELEHTTQPHKYEDPPEVVRGQLLRLQQQPQQQKDKDCELAKILVFYPKHTLLVLKLYRVIQNSQDTFFWPL
jgi:hypothetical protein